MKGWIFFFVFLGALGVASAISGMSSITPDFDGTLITRHSDAFSRCFTGVQGVLLLFVGWAIYHRLRWIWRSVFFLFGLVAVEIGLDIYLDVYRRPRDAMTEAVLTALAIGIVGGYWTYRWYRQRKYFYPEGENG